MKTIEPRTLSGTMELLPKEQILFNQIKDTIKSVYESYGFLPLDTPVINPLLSTVNIESSEDS